MSERQRLTSKQLATYCFAQDFFRENDMLPTAQAIASHFGARSVNTGFGLLKALARRGYLERNAVGKYRFKREGGV